MAEDVLIRLYWEKVSGYLSQLHRQSYDKLLETLAKIRKINWLIKIGLVYGVERHFQQYFSNDGQFYWWRKPEYLVKTTDLSQVAEKNSHNVASSTSRLNGILAHNFSGDRH